MSSDDEESAKQGGLNEVINSSIEHFSASIPDDIVDVMTRATPKVVQFMDKFGLTTQAIAGGLLLVAGGAAAEAVKRKVTIDKDDSGFDDSKPMDDDFQGSNVFDEQGQPVSSNTIN